MPWYAITSLDMTGQPIKREVLYRPNAGKVWKFIGGRIERHGAINDETFGFFIAEAETDETWDWDIEEPREQTLHAQEVPLVFGESYKPE